MRFMKIYALIPTLMLGAASAVSYAAIDVNISVTVPPPAIPVYEQPPLPAPGYIWTPGYWDWDGMDYYWVPGTWVQPPATDLLWTPGYWGWNDGLYVWNAGYWAPEVGFYGGIDYGYGYTGLGYAGGYWHGGAFFYNRSVANFGTVNIVNVYTAPAQHWGRSHVSFNGGRGGVQARPSAAQQAAMHERHVAATPMQRDHQEHARSMPDLHRAHNQGRPQILTTQRPADFAHPGPGLHNHQTPAAPGQARPVMQNEPGPQPGQHESRPQFNGAAQEHERAQSRAAAEPHDQHAQAARDRSSHDQQAPRERIQQQHEAQPPRERVQSQHEQQPPHEQSQPQHAAAPPREQVQPQHQPAPSHEQAPRPPQPAVHEQHPEPAHEGGREGGGRDQGRGDRG